MTRSKCLLSQACREQVRRTLPEGLRLPELSTTSVVARICARQGGIPLAIELAAARVPTLPLEQIASRLEQVMGY